jgi:peroxiredoxin
MMKRAPMLLLAAIVPAYLLLDAAGLLPLWLRDRPLPFAAAAVALALLPRRRAPALALATACIAALAWVSWSRYRLPPASPGAGVGTPLPDLTLPDEAGRPVHLRGDRPLLLVWFRGSWCPYCRRQLAELAAEVRRHPRADVRLVAVSPDPPEPLHRLAEELRVPFPLLSDPDQRLMNRCELAHCVAVAGGDNQVRWGVVSGNWERDLPARALWQAAYRAR